MVVVVGDIEVYNLLVAFSILVFHIGEFKAAVGMLVVCLDVHLSLVAQLSGIALGTVDDGEPDDVAL